MIRGRCDRLWPPVQTPLLGSSDHPSFGTGTSIKGLHSPVLVCNLLTINIYIHTAAACTGSSDSKKLRQRYHEQLNTCITFHTFGVFQPINNCSLPLVPDESASIQSTMQNGLPLRRKHGREILSLALKFRRGVGLLDSSFVLASS